MTRPTLMPPARIRAATTRLQMAAVAVLGVVGCAHHRADPYAFQPPLAPPVYPQPQPVTPSVPYTPPFSSAPAAAPPTLPGPAVAAAGTADPCCQPAGGAVVVAGAAPVVYHEGQTPPCPPGP